MVGSALLRVLEARSDVELIIRTRDQLDLSNQSMVEQFFSSTKIDQVYLAAARVGGIHANELYPAEFAYQNLMIQSNVIHAAHISGVNKLLFLGSSCIYPKLSEQPISEQALLTGSLESTNEAYAIAKIAGVKLCQAYKRQYGRDYRCVMPTNLYGPKDNFHPHNSHVIPALLLRFHQAKMSNSAEVAIWGSGEVMREFLHVDDMAAACLHVMDLSQKDYDDCLVQSPTISHLNPTNSHVNIGTGVDCKISELAETIKRVVGYRGEIVFDTSKPDGTPRKLLDVGRLSKLGWTHKTELRQGISMAWNWYVDNVTKEGSSES